MPAPTGASGWIGAGWTLATQNFSVSVLLALIGAIPSLISLGVTYAVIIGPALATAGVFSGGFRPEAMHQLSQAITQQRFAGTGISLPFTLVAALLWVRIGACFWEGVSTGRLTLTHLGVGFQNAGAALIFGVFFFAINVVMSMLPCIGPLAGVAVMPLCALVLYDVAVRRTGGGGAIGAGWGLYTANLGQLLVMALLTLLICIAGSVLCLIGLFIAMPVIAASYAYCYRDLALQAGLLAEAPEPAGTSRSL